MTIFIELLFLCHF